MRPDRRHTLPASVVGDHDPDEHHADEQPYEGDESGFSERRITDERNETG